MNDVMQHLRRAALLGAGGGPTDSQLLESFINRQDEAAFAALVRRHGPMVHGVCRRVLHHVHDAEDAFQATFLVLARKAASLRSRALVGQWLHGVAYRTALRARTMNARRRAKEQQARDLARPAVPADDGWQELLPLLDQEVDRLPERYRAAVVLCDLEGVTRREAARRLNLPEGTLSGRLTTARKLLARRLARYGLAPSAGALAAALSANGASACVPGAVAASTARVAVLVAAGQALTAGAVPARVVTLTEGVVKTMLLSKLKAFVAVAVVAVGVGVVGLAYRTGAAEPAPGDNVPATARAADRATADDLEALRLEVEALRKGLQATRERVKTLEAEVQALQGKDGAANRFKGAGQEMSLKDNAGQASRQATQEYDQWLNQVAKSRATDDPLAEAEAAVKKLRQDPRDKQATEALERALQRLKERAQPQGTGLKPPRQ
jgi:RNA polymerase sigma factor (sigma-70 family)